MIVWLNYIRRVTISFNHTKSEDIVDTLPKYEQLSLFVDYDEKEKNDKIEKDRLEKEKKRQEAILKVKKKYGKNSIVKGIDLEDGATTIDRNNQIGGHKA